MGVTEERRRINEEVARETDFEIYRGYDWDQICSEEMDVFQLSLQQMPRLVAVLNLFEAAIGLTSDVTTDERVASLRSELPWLPYRDHNNSDFRRFAALFGVSNRTATAFMARYDFWAVRHGLTVYADEQGWP